MISQISTDICSMYQISEVISNDPIRLRQRHPDFFMKGLRRNRTRLKRYRVLYKTLQTLCIVQESHFFKIQILMPIDFNPSPPSSNDLKVIYQKQLTFYLEHGSQIQIQCLENLRKFLTIETISESFILIPYPRSKRQL